MADCPSPEELRRYLRRDAALGAAAVRRVEAHVESCAACQGRLDRLGAGLPAGEGGGAEAADEGPLSASGVDLLARIKRRGPEATPREGRGERAPGPAGPPPVGAPAAAADYNLLFGVLALQMDFISREALIAAVSAWIRDKARPLARILVEQGALPEARRALLEPLVEEHLRAHGDDPEKSLGSVSSLGSVREALAAVADAEVQASLDRVGAERNDDADGTATWSAGQPTSPGGRFRILRFHDRGGRGEVYVAHDRELAREVALKQIQVRYADDPAVRSRFLLEGEITGGLEHPGIVPVYGLGHCDDGRPYYAMRFVKGDSLKKAIVRFHQGGGVNPGSGERALELRRLLGRFLDVCNAVAYAHSRGVLHRDLKPGNILLGPYGETLVVDWGMAKVVGRPEEAKSTGEATLRPPSASGSAETMAGFAMGTPAYMSPEQAAGRLDRLGPGSDVYSLGATLYCLLTGRAPFKDPRTKSDARAVLEAVQRGDFPPPRQVNRAIASALEAICLKAMALEPQGRYSSPRALADDIEDWLADEPVSAWQEPWSVRVRRRLARHRTAVAATATAVLVALVSLTAFTALLVAANQRVGEALARSRANYQLAVRTVNELARVRYDYGNRQSKLIGPTDKALQAYKEALANQEGLLHSHPDDARLLEAHAKTHNNLALLLRANGRRGEALESLLRARDIFERLARAHPEDIQFRRGLALTLGNLGDLHGQVGRPDEAVRLHRPVLKIQQELIQSSPNPTESWDDLARTYYKLGLAQRETGDRAEALRSLQEALSIRTRLARENPTAEFRSAQARTYGALATLQREIGRPDEASMSFHQALEIQRGLVRENPTTAEFRSALAETCCDLGVLQGQTGRPVEALQSYRDACDILEQLVLDNPDDLDAQSALGTTLNNTGVVLADLKRHREALVMHRRAVQHQRVAFTKDPQVVRYRDHLINDYTDLALALQALGQPAEALRSRQELIALLETISRAGPIDLYNLACVRALCVPLVGHGKQVLTVEEQADRRRYADGAMAALRAAVAAGFRDVGQLRADPDLRPLHGRDFEALVGEVYDRIFPADPFMQKPLPPLTDGRR